MRENNIYYILQKKWGEKIKCLIFLPADDLPLLSYEYYYYYDFQNLLCAAKCSENNCYVRSYLDYFYHLGK